MFNSMKKSFILIVMALTMGFASCGNKNAQAPADQSSEESVTVVDNVIDNATAEIAAQLDASDADKLQQAIEAAKAKVQELLKENPELAKEYLSKVQNYLKENEKRVKAVVGDNAVVQTAVSSLTEMSADDIIQSLQSIGAAGQQTIDQTVQKAEEMPEAVKEAIEQKVQEGKEAAKEKAKEKLNEEADKALKKLGL